MKSRYFKFFVLLFLMVGILGMPIRSAVPRRVLIVDVPRFTLDDIRPEHAAFRDFQLHGASGVMTTPLSDPLTADKVYLGLNSGIQLKPTGEDSGLSFNAGEEYQGFSAGELYQSLSGARVNPREVIYIGIYKLFQTNPADSWRNIGLMGSTLHRWGIKTAVIGNADTDIYNRSSVLMVMDPKGKTDMGWVGPETLIRDVRFPFGYRSNPDAIFEAWKTMRSKAGVIVLTLGDLERLERFSVYLSPSQIEEYRRRIVTEYDRFLARLLPEINDGSTLTVLFSTAPPENNPSGNTRLNPVIFHGPGFNSGLLWSDGTRRPGLITCYDISETLLNYVRNHHDPSIGQGVMNGHVLKAVPGQSSVVATRITQLSVNYANRWPLLTGYGYLLIILILGTVLGIIFWPGWAPFFKSVIYAYLFLLLIPGVFLLEALFNPLSWFAILSLTLGLAGILFAVVFMMTRGNYFKMLAWIGGITFVLIFVDGCFNGRMELLSFFGYSAVSGARFYGIGNEYMGFILGAYIVFVAIFPDRFKKNPQVLWLLAGLLAFFIAHPGLGSNIGGGITAIVGLGITNYLWLERKIRLKEMGWLSVAVIGLLLTIALWDFYISGRTMTHFGRFVHQVGLYGWQTVLDTAAHKWDLNVRLIGYTPWTKVLLAILLGAPFFYRRPPAPVMRILTSYSSIVRGFLGLALTAIVGLTVNDSGIATVATLFIFGIFLLLLVILKEWNFLPKDGDEDPIGGGR